MENVIEFLRGFRQENDVSREDGNHHASDDEITAMTLRQFASQDTAVLVRSGVLDEEIYFVPKSKWLPLFDDKRVAYLPEELDILIRVNPPPEALRQVHLVKKILGARLERGQQIE